MRFYFRLAKENIKKNRRLFIPQVLTNAGLLAMCYIILSLALDQRIARTRGGSVLPFFMQIGLIVVGILTFALTFYINSFLMKQRKSEFGLYNVLGMEKRHIGRVLFFESAISTFMSLVLGAVFGVVFYKLSTLILCRIVNIETILGFDFMSLFSLIPLAIVFIGLSLLTYIVNRISIARMKPVELMATKHTGEKEPKIKIVCLILGLITIGIGYYLALSARNPLEAVQDFFIAVPLVVIGTYFLFISLTITVLKILKKRDNFYYSPKHMVSLSGLLYRMKQNAVGLASITILATCVIVMLSTTISLYAGIDNKLKSTFKEDVMVSTLFVDRDEEGVGSGRFSHTPIELSKLSDIAKKTAASHNVEIKNLSAFNNIGTFLVYEDSKFTIQPFIVNSEKLLHSAYFNIISGETYERLTGETLNLSKDEIALCDLSIVNKHVHDSEFTLLDNTYKVKTRINSFPITNDMTSVTEGYGIVVSDKDVYNHFVEQISSASGLQEQGSIAFSVVGGEAEYRKIEDDLINNTLNYTSSVIEGEENKATSISTAVENYWDMKQGLNESLGSLLFLGIILSVVFLFATVLIIYYKQISEGYEDRNNYQILKKVGLTNKEVKRSIRSQILIVFFLPLIIAGIHVLVAFPVLTKLLSILFLASKTLFLLCTVGAVAVFALVYAAIYVCTSNTYYKIVN